MPSLIDQRKPLLDQARAIAERAKARGGPMTAAELEEVEAKVSKVRKLDADAKSAEESDATFRQLMSIGPDGRHGGYSADEPHYLDLSPTAIKRIGRDAARAMVGVVEGGKALLPAGETGLAVPVTPNDPVALGQVPPSLLSVIPVQTISGSQAKYLRQGVRTNNAAAVAPGDPKPVSVYGLTPVDVALKVYATLSEPVDRFIVEDANNLAQFLASELAYSVMSAVERDCLVGVAGGANIVGMLETSGIQTTAFTVDLLTTLRQAVTDLQSDGYTDLTFALSPADWQAAELTKADTSGVFAFPSAPVDQARQAIWGQPVVIVANLPAGVAALFSRSACRLYTDTQGIRLDWGSPGTQWTQNEITARLEGRWDLGVLQPPGVTKIATVSTP